MDDIERELVAWLRKRQAASDAGDGLLLGIGDDMAVLAPEVGPLLVSSDMLLDGVHFDTRKHDLKAIGRKAIGCSLSDCAAMAVRPMAVTVSVALPREHGLSEARRLYEGVFTLAEEFGVAVAGGDTTRWDHPLAIDVAIAAVPFEGVVPVRRDGARRGDMLYVTGALGGSLLGRHLTFVPRVREARAIARTLGDRLHAMIDISDGLALDLSRLCGASGVSATLEERWLGNVISQSARELAASDGLSALSHALGDGEDYELLLAVDGELTKDGASTKDGESTKLDVPLFPVGAVTEGGLALCRADGSIEPLKPMGYRH